MEAIILILLTYLTVKYFKYAIVFYLVLLVGYLIYSFKKSRDLKKWASKNFMDLRYIRRLDGFEFEDYVNKQFMGLGMKTRPTAKSGDFGVDLIVDDKYGVQLKNYTSSVGVSAVQEAYAGSHYYDKLPVVMATNYFTKPAITLANKLKIELIDLDDIKNWGDLSYSRKFYCEDGMYELVRRYLLSSHTSILKINSSGR